MRKIDKEIKHYKNGIKIVVVIALIPIILLIIKGITLIGNYENLFCFMPGCLSSDTPVSISDALIYTVIYGIAMFFMGWWVYYLILLIIIIIYARKITNLENKKMKKK